MYDVTKMSRIRNTEKITNSRLFQSKISELEEKVASLSVEKAALLTESENWKKRSDQLIEKSFKLNPDELRRLQETVSQYLIN
jgi:hypothetical protein